MKIKNILLYTSFMLLLTVACSRSNVEDKKLEKDEDFEKCLVINELMASNRTGIVDENGELREWIEIKNISDDAISLEGYSLAYEKVKDEKGKGEKVKNKKNKNKKGKNEKESGTGAKVWHFPDIEIEAGACLLVYMAKGSDDVDVANNDEAADDAAADEKDENTAQTLRSNFKLSNKGGCLRLISDDHTILSEVAYNGMNHNQVWRRLADGSHEFSYLQSPGYDNDEAGYDAFNQLIDKQRNSPLRIWEMVSKTDKGAVQWVELKNVSSADVKLADYALALKPKNPTKWNLPDKTLKSGEICTVQFGTGKAKASKGKAKAASIVADFKLDDDEYVLLTKNGKFVDGLCAMPTRFGMSMGRTAEGKGFYFFTEPSRGAENKSKGYRYIADSPTFSEVPGPHDGIKSLSLSLNTHGHTVRYTLDGTEPTMKSKVYKDPIKLSKTTIVRAFAEGDDSSVRSSTITETFFINEEHKLPILSVVVDRADLYDYHKGIMVKGPGGSLPEEDHKANYWTKNTERRAHVSFYDGKEGFSTNCEMKVYGGGSREQDKRSLVLKFKAKYGTSSVNYDVFDRGQAEKYTALVLRGGSQDYIGIMARDEFFTSLMASQSPTLLVQDYRPVVLYLNDEYYGIYYIREKINKNYVKRHLGVSGDSIDILSSRFVNDGTDKEFTALRNYAENNDLSQKKHYDYVNSRIEAQGFIDHFLGEFYASNTDLCNVRYVHSCNPAGDTRWHIVYYDLDESWYTFKNSEFFFSGQSRLFIHDGIIRAMLKNPEFRQLFLERTSWHMHNTFSKPYVTKFFNDFMDVIRPEMKRNCERWPDLTYKNWELHQATFVKNFDTRPKAMLNDLRKQLRVTPEEEKKYFGDLGF